MSKEYVYTNDGRIISCALIIQNSNGGILGEHPTGNQWGENCFDLPKGCQEKGEDPLDSVIREVREESGLDFRQFRDQIIDLGIHDYISEKVLHLFYFKYEIDDNTLQNLNCRSYFTDKDGIDKPEVDGYLIIYPDEKDLFYKAIQRVLNKLNLNGGK